MFSLRFNRPSFAFFIFTDESIPFLSIVFKGIVPMYSDYVNFEANKHEFFLKLVETGIYPSFYITMQDSTELYYTNSNDLYSSQYSVYKNTMIEYYKALKEFNDRERHNNRHCKNGLNQIALQLHKKIRILKENIPVVVKPLKFHTM